MNIKETRNYETIFLMDSIFEDEKLDAIVTKYENFLAKNGGEVKTTEKWGRKKLAYPIKNKYTAHYVSIEFSAPSDLMAKLERAYHLDDDVLRFLTVCFDKKTFGERKVYFDRKQADAVKREQEAAALKEQQASAAAEAQPETKQPA